MNTTAAPRITSTVPSTQILHTINPYVSFILRSPLHRLLSGSVMLLTFVGRKTGKHYTIPVNYMRQGDTLTVFSSKSWWKNLRAGAPVMVRLQGCDRSANAEVISDPVGVLNIVQHLIAERGLKVAGAKLGLTLDTTPPPALSELAAALEHCVVIRLFLDSEDRTE